MNIQKKFQKKNENKLKKIWIKYSDMKVYTTFIKYYT